MKLNRKKIEIMMARNGMSWKDLSMEVGISKGSPNAIFKSKHNSPVLCGVYAKVLGCDVTEIIDDD